MGEEPHAPVLATEHEVEQVAHRQETLVPLDFFYLTLVVVAPHPLPVVVAGHAQLQGGSHDLPGRQGYPATLAQSLDDDLRVHRLGQGLARHPLQVEDPEAADLPVSGYGAEDGQLSVPRPGAAWYHVSSWVGTYVSRRPHVHRLFLLTEECCSGNTSAGETGHVRAARDLDLSIAYHGTPAAPGRKGKITPPRESRTNSPRVP